MARKYFIVDAQRYEDFINELTAVGTKKDAMEQADNLAEEAQNAGNPDARFAIFEEVGVQQSQIVRKVTRNFLSSRSIERKPKAEGESATGEDKDTSGFTGEPKRKRGRPSGGKRKASAEDDE